MDSSTPTPDEARQDQQPNTSPNMQPPAGYNPPPPPLVQGQQVPLPPYTGYTSPSSVPGEPPPQSAPPSMRRFAIGAGITVACLFLVSLGFVVGGEPARFMNVGVQFAPFAILGALAYMGAKNGVAAVFCYLWLALLAFLVLFVNFALVLAVFITGDVNTVQPGSNPSTVFKPGMLPALGWAALLLGLVAIISALMLLRPVRVVLSRIMPIDPDNFVHKIALPMLTLIMFGSFVPLIVLGGRPPLLEVVNSGMLESAGGEAVEVLPQDLIYQFVWTIPAALIAAGWPVARRFRAVMVRLGMVRPTIAQATFGVVAGVVLAALAAYVIDPAITWFWQSMGWQTTDVEAFGKLMSNVITPLGAVLIGVTAGIGEEMAVRGLLQPRIGLIASNLVFTALHAMQYGIDALLSVFIIGLVLGIIRARSNTSTSAIVHGVYDFVLVLASALAFQ
ncbi:MAG TPA: CPBP family intramembrane glutamic endopeptidase [Chloroflexia bacterium]|nr:CPBP family intramembrane glutamic endopeptidase [Chloroflexia bacterium]